LNKLFICIYIVRLGLVTVVYRHVNARQTNQKPGEIFLFISTFNSSLKNFQLKLPRSFLLLDYTLSYTHLIYTMSENFCQVCNLSLRSKNDATLHFGGKKHKKLAEIAAKRTSLQRRSVFLFGYTPNTLNRQDFLHYFTESFGKVLNLTLDVNKNSWAIVEFESEQVAQQILEIKRLEIQGQKVGVKARELTESRPKNSSALKRPHSGEDNDAAEASAENLSMRPQGPEWDRVLQVYNSMALTQEQILARKNVCAYLNSIIDRFIVSHVCLELFGSSINGFGIQTSDLDLTVLFTVDDVSNGSIPIRSADELLNGHISQLEGDGNKLSCAEIKVSYSMIILS